MPQSLLTFCRDDAHFVQTCRTGTPFVTGGGELGRGGRKPPGCIAIAWNIMRSLGWPRPRAWLR